MATKWIGFIVFVWLVGSLMCALLEGAVLTGNETTVLNKITYWQTVVSQDSWTPVQMVAAGWTFFNGVWEMLTFRFAFFYGQWEMVRLFILGPIIATIVFGLIVTFFGIFSRNV